MNPVFSLNAPLSNKNIFVYKKNVGLELGVAETSLMNVIRQTTGRSMAQIKADTKSTGDLGIVAERSKSNQRLMLAPAPLTVDGVFTKLREIAKMSGHSVGFFEKLK